MKEKRAKIIITSLTPQPIEHKGKSGGLVRLLEILDRMNRNYDAEILLVTADKDYFQYIKKKGIKTEIEFIEPSLKFRTLWGLTAKSLFLVCKFLFFYPKEFLTTGDKHIFYCSSDLFWETIPAFFCRRRYKNVRWAQVIHHLYPHWRKRSGPFWSNFFGYYLQKMSLILIKKKADIIFVVSETLKNELMRKGFLDNKLFVSPNGLDSEYFENLEASSSIYDGVFLGRLNYSKGFLDLADIWIKVTAVLPSARLAIIGGGNEQTQSSLLRRIDELDLKNNIDVLGFLDDAKAYSLLKSAKIFLFPSHEEGWGIAIGEAMACAVPVVSWNLPIYKEVFENYTFQIRENDVKSFSSKVVELLKNDNLRNAAANRGKDFIKKYSWDKVAKYEMEIISNL